MNAFLIQSSISHKFFKALDDNLSSTQRGGKPVCCKQIDVYHHTSWIFNIFQDVNSDFNCLNARSAAFVRRYRIFHSFVNICTLYIFKSNIYFKVNCSLKLYRHLLVTQIFTVICIQTETFSFYRVNQICIKNFRCLT